MGQIRDSNDPELVALGDWLRALRGRRSLRALAKQVHSTSSTLSRVERGEVLADPNLIESLDRFHELDGALIAERQRLEIGSAERHRPSPWRRQWIHHYPASYAGPVYLQLNLPAESRPARVRLTIRWGPWQLDRPLRIDDPEGVSCLFSKGDDGLSLPLIATLDKRAAISFGIGLPVRHAIDINEGWKRVEPEASDRKDR